MSTHKVIKDRCATVQSLFDHMSIDHISAATDGATDVLINFNVLHAVTTKSCIRVQNQAPRRTKSLESPMNKDGSVCSQELSPSALQRGSSAPDLVGWNGRRLNSLPTSASPSHDDDSEQRTNGERLASLPLLPSLSSVGNFNEKITISENGDDHGRKSNWMMRGTTRYSPNTTIVDASTTENWVAVRWFPQYTVNRSHPHVDGHIVAPCADKGQHNVRVASSLTFRAPNESTSEGISHSSSITERRFDGLGVSIPGQAYPKFFRRSFLDGSVTVDLCPTPLMVDPIPPVTVDPSPPLTVDSSPPQTVDRSPLQSVDPSFPQTVDPSPPLAVDPSPLHTVDHSFPQTVDPSPPLAVDPSFPQTVDPSFPQTVDPSPPLAVDPSFPQTVDPSPPRTVDFDPPEPSRVRLMMKLGLCSNDRTSANYLIQRDQCSSSSRELQDSINGSINRGFSRAVVSSTRVRVPEKATTQALSSSSLLYHMEKSVEVLPSILEEQQHRSLSQGGKREQKNVSLPSSSLSTGESDTSGRLSRWISHEKSEKHVLFVHSSEQSKQNFLRTAYRSLTVESVHQKETDDERDDETIVSSSRRSRHKPAARSSDEAYESGPRRVSTSDSFFPPMEFRLNLVDLRSREDFRVNYLKKLSYANVWIPKARRPPQHQTISIFDWDDTLLCTSYINLRSDDTARTTIAKQLSAIEYHGKNLLTAAMKMGRVFLITNAMSGWVEYSARKYLPGLLKTLQSVSVVSARHRFEGTFPGDYHRWKIHAFLEVQKTLNSQIITNLISMGDSTIEMDAVHIMGREFSQALIKTIKFRENPSPDELAKQLELVSQKFEKICLNARNLKIGLERRVIHPRQRSDFKPKAANSIVAPPYQEGCRKAVSSNAVGLSTSSMGVIPLQQIKSPEESLE